MSLEDTELKIIVMFKLNHVSGTNNVTKLKYV